jgi:hypothetical protein
MPQDHRLQQQRFELKYLVEEAMAPCIRDFVSSYLAVDDYGAGQPDLSYPVHSLYLDSDDLKTHWAYLNSTKNRFKLRLRYYNSREDSPVFCEIKARVDSCILKRRCGVRRQAVPTLVAGHLPPPEDLLSHEARHWAALQRFSFLLQQLDARPKLHNCYRREAWVSPEGNSVRVTFDRDICCEPFFEARAAVPMARPVRLFPGLVVLELKFTTRFPDWFREMVEHFNLMQASSAKYSTGVALLGEELFRGPRRHPNGLEPFRPAATQGIETRVDLAAVDD